LPLLFSNSRFPLQSLSLSILSIAADTAAIMAERRLFTAAAPGCCEAELLGVTGWNGSFLGINVDQTQVGASNFH
jgi:limonene-1,2-epoxide hydrolase